MHAKICPFCRVAARTGCDHLALAAEGRDFVRLSVQACEGQSQWQRLCSEFREKLRRSGDWEPDKEDFTWLETAFSARFLQHLAWFGGLDYEWRSGDDPAKGGFWVLLWSKNPQRLWWELRDEFEKQSSPVEPVVDSSRLPPPFSSEPHTDSKRLPGSVAPTAS